MPPPSEPQPPATLQAGDTSLHASAIQASSLGEAAARRYGVERDPGTVLLVVGVRRGPAMQESSIAADVSARATTLLGQTRTIALREVRSDGFIDYVGSVEMAPPETLRFEIVARAAGAAPMRLRFQRDYFP